MLLLNITIRAQKIYFTDKIHNTNKTYEITGEPKSGTTWITSIVAETVNISCYESYSDCVFYKYTDQDYIFHKAFTNELNIIDAEKKHIIPYLDQKCGMSLKRSGGIDTRVPCKTIKISTTLTQPVNQTNLLDKCIPYKCSIPITR
jgi:hypothetical protein